MMSLRTLQHFSVLAEELHFSRAAQRLHLTQSALSRSIQSLESSLGLKLLDRTASGVSLTKPGQTVLRRARRILAETESLESESKRILGLETGDVAMGAGVFPAASFLAPLLTELAQHYPGITMRVEIESWRRLLEMLEQNQLDFVVAITHSLPPSTDFTVLPLPAQHGGLFVRAAHPLLSVPHKQFRQELVRYQLAATHLPPRARAHLAGLYRLSAGEVLPLALECNSIETLRAVTLHSDSVLFCMREAIANDIASGQLVQLPLTYSENSELKCNVIYDTRRTLSPAAQKIVSLIEPLMTNATISASR